MTTKVSLDLVDSDIAQKLQALAPFAEGDLICGTGINSLGKVSKGSALQILRRNATNDGFEYVAPSDIPTFTAYTPTLQGVVASGSVHAFYQRSGDAAIIHGWLTAGSSSAVELQFGLPAGLTVNAAKNPVTMRVGGAIVEWDIGGDLNCLGVGGAGYIAFGLRKTTYNPFTPLLGSALLPGGSILSLEATVAITEWA